MFLNLLFFLASLALQKAIMPKRTKYLIHRGLAVKPWNLAKHVFCGFLLHYSPHKNYPPHHTKLECDGRTKFVLRHTSHADYSSNFHIDL